ncbi:hypothetical protein ACLQ3C_07400 [Gordonia sp. DT30]|uniref:hypothetical protein n=1 Tax=unclassified Gordonia (in: high G+C Gram-positive bacteria) TaxID=2657482 RepID=UPI003CF0B050
MTDSTPEEPDRTPSQAELDAEDLAELQRTSADRDRANLYPKPAGAAGPPPPVLALHARVTFWAAAAAGLACVVYGAINLGTIGDLLRDRMLADTVTTPKGQPSTSQIDTFASVLPVAGLVITVLFLIGEYLFLIAAANHHSRNCRNFFLALVVLNLMCIPVGLDLFFRYPSLWSGTVVLGWIQFGLLLVAAVMTLRRAVDRWLPESTRMRPSKMMRAR